ncbi:DUF397 domain-containing protein [Streptomyces yunnanensis]|uniref:DUF397 domain-containing protein n=1 Tax=Streptomyces yunnanensis TaxID=156453 RepID=A0A9X8MYM6_9ACTN|nr:DUF397 domain-containing protein [Streptomyces yunnanensis]SHM32188.1 protein of unknown function [Streptomyces yunnanensis]
MNSELVWRKSSYSGSAGGECVEAATSPATAHVLIRDSKDKPGPHLTLTPSTWAAFVRYAASAPVWP